MTVSPPIHCTGVGRHPQCTGNLHFLRCVCGARWAEDGVDEAGNVQAASVQERIKCGELTDEEAQYLADLKSDYLRISAADVPGISSEFRSALHVAFVSEWATRFNLTPDDDQAAAIATGWLNAIVEARAGSGKTRTIIGRALFLINKCGLAADEILILAFNTRAAQELKERLRTYALPSMPHVMTFHALARRIVNPTEGFIYDESDDTTGAGKTQTRVIDNIIRDYLSTAENNRRVRDLMRLRFKRDDSRAEKDLLFATKSAYIDFMLHVPFLALGGERVKSYGEQQIANTLFVNSVDYHYERALPMRIEGAVYRPDFTVPPKESGGKRVVIEYFGMKGRGEYDELTVKKRAFWSAQDPVKYQLLEYEPADIRDGAAFSARLVEDLHAQGVETERLDGDEVWRRIEKGAILTISEALRDFVQQARKRNWDADDARAAVSSHVALDDAENLFLGLAVDVFREYLDFLSVNEKIDFDELINRATRMVNDGETAFRAARGDGPGNLRKVRAVLVDEFQDFNSQFHGLLAAARVHMKDSTLFAVGDPWQAINAFAGASTRYFESFADDYPPAVHHVIATNYRSSRAVVDVGNAVMRGRSEVPARAHASRAGRVRVFDGSEMPPDKSARSVGSTPTLDSQAKARLVKAARLATPEGERLFVLSRTTGPASDLSTAMREHLTKEHLERTVFTTVHQSKGLEADYVVILDGGPGMFPLVHPNWVFSRIFGSNLSDIERDERNLFYVAITRAATEAWVLLPDGESTPFLPSVKSLGVLTKGKWSDAPPLATYGMARVAVSGYERREELKALGFEYDKDAKQWCFYTSSTAEGVVLLSRMSPHPDLKATITDATSDEQRKFAAQSWPR